MLNLKELIIDAFIAELGDAYLQTYGPSEPHYRHTLLCAARQALEAIASADTLYHTVEHTVMVTLAGQAILQGKQLREGTLSPKAWLEFVMALLFHDIGYVRGVCRGDRGNVVATGIKGETIKWPTGKSAAVLAPYHIDRGKLFIRERFGEDRPSDIDLDVIVECIERTRFPVPDDARYQNSQDLPGLVRAADLIGQLADPDYPRKIPALFYEYEETGMNERYGYRNPDSMRKGTAKFYSAMVSPYIQEALRYLQMSQAGKRWMAHLYAHVFEHE